MLRDDATFARYSGSAGLRLVAELFEDAVVVETYVVVDEAALVVELEATYATRNPSFRSVIAPTSIRISSLAMASRPGSQTSPTTSSSQAS
jgi:hypothetical protein